MGLSVNSIFLVSDIINFKLIKNFITNFKDTFEKI